MKIVVTGAAGFIGSELIKELKCNDDVQIIALTRSDAKEAGSPFCVWQKTDYSEESLSVIFAGEGKPADALVHLAAVRGTSSDFREFAANEEITESVLGAIKNAGIKRMVFASSISVYDDVDLIPWKEDSALKGRTLYGRTKISCENMIKEHADNEGFTYAIVRIAQVLGTGEKRRGMMNVFMDKARDGESLSVIGKSEAKRQYIYVRDLAKILADASLGICGFNRDESVVVNAGMAEAYTNLEIARIVNDVFENPAPVEYKKDEPETISSSFMDIDRLVKMTGHAPRNMREALLDIRQSSL